MTIGVDLSITELIKLGKASAFALQSKKHIQNQYSGIKPSKIKGHGIDFDQIREYQFGDDIRSIDWKATAKLQKTYIRTYKEERQRPILLLVDFSQSMYFGTKVAFKSVIAARLATLLGFLAAQHDDRVGALIYSHYAHLEIKPKPSKLSVQTLIRGLVHSHKKAFDSTAQHPALNTLHSSLLRLKRSTKPGSLIFIISDFADFEAKSQSLVQQLSKHNEVVFNFIYDPLEKTAPKTGHYLINDGKTFGQMNISKKTQAVYQQHFAKKLDFLTKFTYYHRQPFISLPTNADLVQTLKDNLSVFKR